jgi:hypothetical protein
MPTRPAAATIIIFFGLFGLLILNLGLGDLHSTSVRPCPENDTPIPPRSPRVLLLGPLLQTKEIKRGA